LPYLLHTIDDQAQDGKTALSLAARRGDLAAVNLLLRYGANPNIYDNRGNGPLHSAACSTNWRCIPALLEYGADATHNNSRNESPVNYALFYADDPHYLQPLLDAGANVNNRDYNGDTPLITATYRAPPSAPVAAFGAVNCVDYLIRRGANLESCSSQGNTPVLNAVIHNNVGTLRVLLQYGADYHVRNLVGDTILHLAARHGDLATLRLLTDAALRDLDLDALNDDGYTPKETTRQRVSNIRGFDKAFDELLLSIATEIAMDSMAASTVITVSSYDDAVEYQVALRTPPEPEREEIPFSTPLIVLPAQL
jgi:ankyrin repeat protein